MRSPRGIDISSELAELARSRMREVRESKDLLDIYFLIILFLLKSILNLQLIHYYLNKNKKSIHVYVQMGLFNVIDVEEKHNFQP
jgi:hypothetical protein